MALGDTRIGTVQGEQHVRVTLVFHPGQIAFFIEKLDGVLHPLFQADIFAQRAGFPGHGIRHTLEYGLELCSGEHILQLIQHLDYQRLVIPGENDSEEELNSIAKFIADLDKDIPWHISRFHPNYQFTNYQPTPVDTLRKASKIGKDHGLHYIYLGNVLEGSDTYCYNCNELLVKRTYFYTEKFNIEQGKCCSCQTKIEGVWPAK